VHVGHVDWGEGFERKTYKALKDSGKAWLSLVELMGIGNPKKCVIKIG